MAEGPQAGLRILEELGDRAKGYYPFHVVRADLLRRSGQIEEAISSYEQAIALCGNPAQRAHLQRQLDPLIHVGRES
jgi:RNA polymerase sigma-70 factor (ECF subfamily)